MPLKGLLVFLVALPAAAAIVTFDFESESPTFTSPPDGSRPGALTTLGITASGLTLTITRESGIAFDLVSNTGTQAGKPAGWGTVSLDPFFAESSPTAFILNFSAPITSFSVEAGDYGGDADTLLVQAFSAADLGGSLVDSSSTPYDSSFTNIITGTAGGGSILSVRLIGGSPDFQNSMFYDNITVDTGGAAGVPEPGTWLLVAGSLGGFALIRRRRA